MKINSCRVIQIIFLLVLLSISVFSQDAVESVRDESEKKPAVVDTNNGNGYNAEQIIEMNKSALISIWYHTDNYFDYYTYSSRDTTLLNGSGFIFDKSGLVGTNFHVADGIDSLLIKTSDGTFYDAELLLMDEKNDMAILRIKNTEGKEFPTVRFGNSDAVKVGQDVFAIGSPLGYEYTISQGIIAGIRENEKVTFTDPMTYMPVEKNFEKVIQITAAISPGNSGGALFNKKGEVIGITTFTYTGYGNLNFAIHINGFLKFTNSVDLANIDKSEEAKKKRNESLFNSNFRLAKNFHDQVTYNWFYAKQKDTMKVYDTLTVKQDSIVRVNFGKAENHYSKCIELQPDSFYVYSSMMDLYVFTESFNKAESLYTKIKERFQSDSLLSLLSSSLANAYTTNKEFTKALQFYEKMLKKDTNDVYIYYQIANIHEQMGKYKKAIREYNQLIKRDSTYTQAYIQTGKIYYEKLNDQKTAKQYFDKAYERESIYNSYSAYNVDIYYYLGMIAVKERRKFDALLSYLELKQTYTYSPEDNEKKVKLYKALQKLN